MKIAVSTLVYSQKSAAEALEEIAKLPTRYVDLAILENWCHFSPAAIAEWPQVQYETIRTMLDRHGLTVIAFNAGLREPDRKKELEKMRALVDLACKLGVKVITLPSEPEDTPLSECIEHWRPLIDVAASKGVSLTAETHAGTVTAHPENALKLVQQIEGLGLTLDISHYYCNHTEDLIPALMPYVKHVHVRDCGREWENIQLDYGTGMFDFPRWLRLLEEHRYQGWITVEYIDQLAKDFDAVQAVQHCIEDYNSIMEGMTP